MHHQNLKIKSTFSECILRSSPRQKKYVLEQTSYNLIISTDWLINAIIKSPLRGLQCIFLFLRLILHKYNVRFYVIIENDIFLVETIAHYRSGTSSVHIDAELFKYCLNSILLFLTFILSITSLFCLNL